MDVITFPFVGVSAKNTSICFFGVRRAWFHFCDSLLQTSTDTAGGTGGFIVFFLVLGKRIEWWLVSKLLVCWWDCSQLGFCDFRFGFSSFHCIAPHSVVLGHILEQYSCE